METIASQFSHWQRLRWQFALAFAAAAFPALMRLAIFGLDDPSRGTDSFANATWGGILAAILGVVLLRNLGRYPGVEKAAGIVPSFSLSFGILVVALLMLRLDYSRWILGGAYVSTIVAFYVGMSTLLGRRDFRIGILSLHGQMPSLPEIPDVEWVHLENPDADVSQLHAVAADLRVDMPESWERRIADLAIEGKPIYHSKHLVESMTGRVELEHLSETSYGTLSPSATYLTFKFLGDRALALVILTLLSPLLILVAMAIRVNSPGPAIFRQKRMGFRGKEFTVLKFRTMHFTASGPTGRNDAITVENDSRITSVGRILRRTRIDELPQLINVVRGEMSMIGPRPEAAVLSEWYEDAIPFYRYRHIVRPGITGWAQVIQGHVTDVDSVRSKLYYDFYYIKNFSLWIDVLIILRTFRIMASGFGAK